MAHNPTQILPQEKQMNGNNYIIHHICDVLQLWNRENPICQMTLKVNITKSCEIEYWGEMGE